MRMTARPDHTRKREHVNTMSTTTSVEVRDDKGTVLGRVRVGDTKLQALERLGRVGAGGLYDGEDVGLLERDTISSNDGPYVFKPTTKHDDNILGDGVYAKLTKAVCFFRDEESSPIGSGFAISPTRVYSVAHNFANPAVGSEVICHFGKPNQHIIRRVAISSVDIRMDYCILDIAEGEVNFPDHLEVSTDPLEPGKNCVLAAFQIGIQQDLKDLDPHLSIGVFKGEIAKLYPRHFVYQCPSFAGDSGGAIVLRDGRAVGIHQETVIQARERIQHRADLDVDARLESVEASVDELIRSLSSGSIGLQLAAIR